MSVRLAVDHLVVLVPDLAAAAAAFTEAGFRTTPLTRHSAEMGTANVCVMLENAYVELMGIVAETQANAGWRTLLADGAGVRGVAFASRDIELTADALAARGAPGEPVRTFSRTTPEGELRFSVIRIPRDTTPGLQCLYCQHHTPELLWRRDLLDHPNGARRITAASLPGADALAPFAADEADSIGVEAGPSAITFTNLRPPSSRVLADVSAAAGVELHWT